MTRKEALAELIAKVEAGKIPSRALDAEVDAVLRIGTPKMQKEARWAYTNFPNWSAKEGKPGYCQTDPGGLWWESQKFTTSLDAAKALHEAVLPEWGWRIQDCGILCAIVVKGDTLFEAISTQAARAWLLAILRALHAQEGGDT